MKKLNMVVIVICILLLTQTHAEILDKCTAATSTVSDVSGIKWDYSAEDPYDSPRIGKST